MDLRSREIKAVSSGHFRRCRHLTRDSEPRGETQAESLQRSANYLSDESQREGGDDQLSHERNVIRHRESR